MKASRLVSYGVAVGLVVLVVWIVISKKKDAAPNSSQARDAVSVAGTYHGSKSATAPKTTGQSMPARTTASRVPTAGAGVSGPASLINGQKVAYSGAFAKASITTSGKTYDLTPNQMGYFGRIDVAPKSTIPVSVAFPEGNSGDVVNVVVEDGGHINQDQMAMAATLDDAKTIAFDFTTTDQPGIYRIALRNGADVKVLSFWVGPEPLLRN